MSLSALSAARRLNCLLRSSGVYCRDGEDAWRQSRRGRSVTARAARHLSGQRYEHFEEMSKPKLYSYFRSSCSWRVRIALNWKHIDYDYEPVHLLRGEQREDAFLSVNSMGQVPALVCEGRTVTQSVAIMELLEEKFPGNPLLPKDEFERAKVREIVEIICSGTQPVQNLSVAMKVSEDKGKIAEWSHYWIEKGLRAVEKVLETSSGKYCVGDNVTLADCCLVPQLGNAKRFRVDLGQFPVMSDIESRLSDLEAFKKAHPLVQPDCPDDLK